MIILFDTMTENGGYFVGIDNFNYNKTIISYPHLFVVKMIQTKKKQKVKQLRF